MANQMRNAKSNVERDDSGERGSVLIELAMVVFPLMLIAMGMIEFGLTWRDKDNVEHASRAGARVAANLANNDQTDREALLTLLASLNPDEADEIAYVVFYRFDPAVPLDSNCTSTDATVPDGKLTPPPGLAGVCNVYTPASFAALNDPLQWGCGAGCWDANWDPTTRSPEFHTPVDLGVYIQSHRDWITGMIPGDGINFSGESVFRLNPLNR